MLIVFDVTDPESFDAVTRWKEAALAHCREHMPFILVGNKTDLKD